MNNPADELRKIMVALEAAIDTDKQLNELSRDKVAGYIKGMVGKKAPTQGGTTPAQNKSLEIASKKLNSPNQVKVPAKDAAASNTEKLNEAWKYADAMKHVENIIKTCDMLSKQQDVGKLQSGYGTIKGMIQTLDQWLEQSTETQALRQPK